MKKYPNLTLCVLLVLTLIVGAFLGNRIGRVREAELFYRWILAAATQFRVFANLTAEPADPEEKNMMDRELFRRIIDATETLLPDQGMTDETGQPMKRIIAAASDASQDWTVWKLASGNALASERQDFLRYLRERKLWSVASEFDPTAVYSDAGAGVSLSNIFLGFRKLAANFVWLQVDRYWHQGNMHRMIPLMKTCVTLDPNFVDAYLVGAWHLAYNATAKMPDTPEPLKKYYPKYGVRLGEKELYYYLAIDFLKDGIHKNPRNYKLYFDLGFGIYNLKLKDYRNAVRYLSDAIRYKHDRWVPRQLYICMELNGQYEDALAGWQDYLKRWPDNPTAPRFIKRNQGLIKERQAGQAAERAKNAKTPEEGQAARAEAERLRAEATQLYESMSAPGEEIDSFAVGRILRMKAQKLIEQQRYLEAVAVLQNAWSKSATFAEEALRMIRETKIKAGIPLSTSEKKAVMREEEAAKYKNMSPEATAAP
jgi:hypothetical protein